MENQNKQENINPVRGKTPAKGGSSADYAFQAGRTSNGINQNRRKFLTAMLIGSGAFLVEKILDPLSSWFSSDSSAKAGFSSSTTNLRGFQVVEGRKGLSVYDGSGEEILQIDRET